MGPAGWIAGAVAVALLAAWASTRTTRSRRSGRSNGESDGSVASDNGSRDREIDNDSSDSDGGD
jgi:hypothetical protein